MRRSQRRYRGVPRKNRVPGPESFQILAEKRRAHGPLDGPLLHIRQAVWPKRGPAFILKPHGIEPVVVRSIKIRLHLWHLVRIRARSGPVVNPRALQIPNVAIGRAHKNIVRHVR